MSLVLGIYVLEAQLRKLSRMNSTCSDKVDIRMVAIASISFTAVEGRASWWNWVFSALS